MKIHIGKNMYFLLSSCIKPLSLIHNIEHCVSELFNNERERERKREREHDLLLINLSS